MQNNKRKEKKYKMPRILTAYQKSWEKGRFWPPFRSTDFQPKNEIILIQTCPEA